MTWNASIFVDKLFWEFMKQMCRKLTLDLPNKTAALYTQQPFPYITLFIIII